MEIAPGWSESPATQMPPLAVIESAQRRQPSSSSRQPRSVAQDRPTSVDGGRPSAPAIELILYVSAVSPHSIAALRNLKRTLAQYGGDAVRLTVCDLSKEPSRADHDGVHFTPSLVASGRGPRTWIVGHLGNPQVLQAFLESALEPKQ